MGKTRARRKARGSLRWDRDGVCLAQQWKDNQPVTSLTSIYNANYFAMAAREENVGNAWRSINSGGWRGSPHLFGVKKEEMTTEGKKSCLASKSRPDRNRYGYQSVNQAEDTRRGIMLHLLRILTFDILTVWQHSRRVQFCYIIICLATFAVHVVSAIVLTIFQLMVHCLSATMGPWVIETLAQERHYSFICFDVIDNFL